MKKLADRKLIQVMIDPDELLAFIKERLAVPPESGASDVLQLPDDIRVVSTHVEGFPYLWVVLESDNLPDYYKYKGHLQTYTLLDKPISEYEAMGMKVRP